MDYTYHQIAQSEYQTRNASLEQIRDDQLVKSGPATQRRSAAQRLSAVLTILTSLLAK